MAVSKKLRALYWSVFDGLETACANLISRIQENRYLMKYITSEPIPSDFKRECKKFWSKYNIGSSGVRFAWYYASQNGIKSPKYIPNTLMYTKIDQYFNDRKLGWGFNDKNYYNKIFVGIPQPNTIVRKIKGFIYDKDYNLLSEEEALQLIKVEDEIICKPTLETGSGRGIRFWRVQESEIEIMNFLKNPKEADYIVQSIIKQHKELNRIHSSSLNTIRICSILMKDGVHILSSCLRMGTGGARVDNVTAGGISAGIEDNGRIKKVAYSYYTGRKFDTHPQGMVFEGFIVPSYDKAVNLVKKAHPIIGHFRLVSWDVAIDENGEALLIEANMRNGGINLHQFSNGPLFGDMTEIVLDEVFGVSK